MLQVARLAPRLLGDSADLVATFLRGQLNADGGWRNRAGDSDLYYTVFGLESLLALRVEPPVAAVVNYLSGFGAAENLDLVHAACLARCWAALPRDVQRPDLRQPILRRINCFRSADGAYSVTPASLHGSLYGCFIAWGAHQDLSFDPPDPQPLLRCIDRLRADDGGYANGDDLPMGLTPPTAAAATLMRSMGHPPPPDLAQWLLSRHHADGGFFATPVAPIPDLLSTATALHALAEMEVDLAPIKEPCLDFIDSLWTNRGAFYGNWTEQAVDCEYTWYALLALGHLSL